MLYGKHFAFRAGTTDGDSTGTAGLAIRVGDLSTGAHRLWIAEAISAQAVAPNWVLFARNPVSTANEGSPPLLVQRFDPETLGLLGTPSPVLQEVHAPGANAAFAVSASGVLVAAVDNHSFRPLVWVDDKGRAVESFSSHAMWSIALSPDKRRLAMGGFGMWIHERDRGLANRLSIQSSNRTIFRFPAWSPDGLSIALTAQFPGSPQIQVYDLQRGETRLLFENQGREPYGHSWSPDGTELAFWLEHGGDASQAEAWILSLKNGEARRLRHATSAAGNQLAGSSGSLPLTWPFFLALFCSEGVRRGRDAASARL